MGNKSVKKVPVNKKHFMKVLNSKNYSIRKIGKAYEIIERSERTIRRYLDQGEMPIDLLNNIAKYLNVTPEYLSGFYDDKAERIRDPYLRDMYKSHIKPENYPYILKEKSDIEYNDYFKSILIMNDISMDLFNTLPPEERVLFRQEMIVAIMKVIAKHFKYDSLGHSTSDILAYCESNIGDNDPFSYFAELEGIGISDSDSDDETF